MAYALLADINALAGSLVTFSGSTVPSQTQIEGWIDQHGAELDAALTDAGYTTVPVTNATDLLLVKRHVAEAVALKALTVFYSWQPPEAAIAALGGYQAWADWLDKIRTGKVTLGSETGSANLVTQGLTEQLGAADYGFVNYPHPDWWSRSRWR
jgi:hypothetical protein